MKQRAVVITFGILIFIQFIFAFIALERVLGMVLEPKFKLSNMEMAIEKIKYMDQDALIEMKLSDPIFIIYSNQEKTNYDFLSFHNDAQRLYNIHFADITFIIFFGLTLFAMSVFEIILFRAFVSNYKELKRLVPGVQKIEYL